MLKYQCFAPKEGAMEIPNPADAKRMRQANHDRRVAELVERLNEWLADPSHMHRTPQLPYATIAFLDDDTKPKPGVLWVRCSDRALLEEVRKQFKRASYQVTKITGNPPYFDLTIP